MNHHCPVVSKSLKYKIMADLLVHDSTKLDLDRILLSSPHAIGVQGDRGAGKKYLASFVAGEVLGNEDISSYPYYKELDCSKKIGIDEVRDAIKFLALKIPGDKKYRRCLVFQSFEFLGHEAQNALLKSIEEPPGDTLIIITTVSKTDLLPTIVSRVSWISIRPVSMNEAVRFFSKEYDEESIKKAHMLSGGNPGLLLKLLLDYDNHPVTGSINFAKDILRLDRLGRISAIEKINKDKDFDMGLFLSSLAKIYEAACRNSIKKSGRTDRKLLADLKRILEAQKTLSYNSSQKLVLTDLLYNL